MRFGLRGIVGSAACLIAGVVLGVLVWQRSASTGQHIAVVVVLAALATIVVRDARHIASGAVLFAVHRGGIYFGSDPVVDDVPWETIVAVELYDERSPRGRASSVHHCIGVRVAGTNPVQRDGNTPGAEPLRRVSARYFEDAGRADLLPGADGTIRWTTRRMSGWRVDRRKLAEAVQRCSPGTPVITGPDWPQSLTPGEALIARRVQRRAGR
ncbi:MAG: hypothetical protein JWN39_3652 [Ilumatobacteraceae bacterium]|nr:hypothetical protein [Ilumatobacteraceae bacterium]